MGLCGKCKDNFWLPPEPVVWKNPLDQLEYCVFHAPKHEKWKELGANEKYTDDDFNAKIFAKIDNMVSRIGKGFRNGSCNLNGVIIPGDIALHWYNKGNPLPPISFTGATFCGNAWFRGTCFSGIAVFDKACFAGYADFSQANFNGETGFYNAKFCRLVSFSQAIFSYDAWFYSAIFGELADFHGVKAEEKRLRLHAITRTSVEHIHFTPFELPFMSFLGCEWSDRLGTETHGDGSAETLKACEELYRAMKQRAISEHDMPMASRWHGKEKEMALRRIQMEAPDWSVSAASQWLSSEAWPQLKHAAAHAREKVKQVVIDNLSPTALNALPRTLFATRLFRVSWWYNLSSGFGENPAQAARVLCALVVFVLGLMAFPGMREPGKEIILDPGNGERVYAALQHLLFITNPQYAPASSTLRSLLLVLTRLVIPIQAALFGFAMFNRFRR